MMKNILTIFFMLFLTENVFGQKHCLIQLEVILTDTSNDRELLIAKLYDNGKVLDDLLISTSDINHLDINEIDIPFKTDSVYLMIYDFIDKNNDLKIFINDLNLFEYNTFGNYKVKILEYRILNDKEYRKYLKKYMLIPKRKVVYAIDVH